MSQARTICVLIPPELDDFIKSLVAEGKYFAECEVVREALYVLHQLERPEEAKRRLREKLQRGVEEAERGDFMDGDEFFKLLRKRIEDRLSQSCF
jgi:putative addiction module CopG family antidote